MAKLFPKPNFLGLSLILCPLVFFVVSCQTPSADSQPSPLKASFLCTPVSPEAGQTVQFTDTSTGSPTSWQWNFGDGTTSTAKNPTHTYANAASYSITLTLANGSGSEGATQIISISPSSNGTRFAASPALADVRAAILSANPGDTVIVPAGSATWSSGLLITKGVVLKGAGIGLTNITMSAKGGLSTLGKYAVQYNPSDWSLDSPFRLTGFTFDLGGQSAWLALGEAYHREPFTIQDRVRIDHNRITNPMDTDASMIRNFCEMYGVVDNNEFVGAYYPFKSDTAGTENYLWDTSPQNIWEPGTNQSLYFEDNLIEMAPGTGASGDNILTDGQYSARYVYRYNEITGAQSYSLFEIHGHQTSDLSYPHGMGCCFGVEIYGNMVICTSGWSCALFKQRSGKSLIYYNSVTTSSDLWLSAYTSSGDSPQPLSLLPTLARTHDSYYFRNRKGLNGALAAVEATGGLNYLDLWNVPRLGRDVMGDSSSPGVGAGPLANRPSSCGFHQGYWATDQSITDLTGMVGRNPASPVAGSLYVCQAAGTWMLFYTPYAYPHPLRNDPVIGD